VNVARAYVNQAELDQAVARILAGLGQKVVRLRYSLEDDWSGDPAIFFRILLADNLNREERFALSQEISSAIVRELKPLDQWGVLPYFNFRRQSEQAILREPAWE
jgi:hypothetical protein